MLYSGHILVIEDDASIRQVLVEVLRDEGYRVQAVGDGRQALEHLAAATPSLLILDVALPHVDGLTICRWVRREPRLSPTPVLMISAYSQPSILENVQKCGASIFLSKPFDLDVLVAQVASLLASASLTTVAPSPSPAATGEPSQRALTAGKARVRRGRKVYGRSQRPTPVSEEPNKANLLDQVASS